MKSFAILKTVNKSYGETELCIIPEIEALVKATNVPFTGIISCVLIHWKFFSAPLLSRLCLQAGKL
jgi:hypothetical protein